MAVKAHLRVDQGADFSANIDLANDDGVPFDLTGYTVRSMMRKSEYSSNAFEFATEHTGAAGSIITTLTSEQTAAIPTGRYLYDVFISSPGGTVTKISEGVVTVNPGITR